MEESITKKNKENRLLKMCYKLAQGNDIPESAKDIIEKKIQGLPDDVTPCSLDSLPSSEMHILSELLYSLIQEKDSKTNNLLTAIPYYSENNEYAGERSFLNALLALRISRNLNQRNVARRHIQDALRTNQDDPRYNALAEILLSIDK